jgi:hypothetical protein
MDREDKYLRRRKAADYLSLFMWGEDEPGQLGA